MWPSRGGAIGGLTVADGGYAFKQTAGYDIKDAGVLSEACSEVSVPTQENGCQHVASQDMDYSVAESEFVAGNVAMDNQRPFGAGQTSRKLALTTA